MIRISVIRLENGMLAGRSFSDRWNLDTLRSLDIDIDRCQTKGQIDHVRRRLKALGFAFSVKQGTFEEIEGINEAEYALVNGSPRPLREVA